MPKELPKVKCLCGCERFIPSGRVASAVRSKVIPMYYNAACKMRLYRARKKEESEHGG